MGAVVFSQTAKWNAKLTNPYRTRWASAGGRYFTARADRLDAPWFVEEVTADGEFIGYVAGGVFFRLSDARNAILDYIKDAK